MEGAQALYKQYRVPHTSLQGGLIKQTGFGEQGRYRFMLMNIKRDVREEMQWG